MRISPTTAQALWALPLVLGLAGCSSYTTYSTASLSREQEIRIDGKTDDWRGSLSMIEDGSVSVGFQNDLENLFVCLMVEEESLQAQAMRQGLTVWFDPLGGKAKSLGIRYPLGLPRGERPGGSPDEQGSPPSADIHQERASAIGILRSEKENPQKMELADLPGIEIMVGPSRGLFVYELKIPLSLTESHRVAVGARPGQTIGIGFEIPKLDRDQMSGPPPGGMPGGGGRPPTGGAPGAGGGGRPPGGPPGGGGPGGGMIGEVPDGLKFWTLVRLSPEETRRPTQVLSASKITD